MPIARGRAPARSGPRHPVVLVALAAVAVYALTEGLVARSVATDSWWRVEWVRLHVRFAHPGAAYGRPLPRPGWADWLPGTVSAVMVVAALTVLALLLAGSGRGWWLL